MIDRGVCQMPTPTQLALAIIQVDDVSALAERLTTDDFDPVQIDATGGFLRRGNVVLLVALNDERMPAYIEAVRATCRARTTIWFPMVTDNLSIWAEPIDIEVGGAIVFVFPIARAVHIGLQVERRPAIAGAA